MLESACKAGAARLIPVSAATRGLEGRALVDFESMAAAGARLISDDGAPIDDETVLARAFAAASPLDLAVSLHEEDRALTGRGAVNSGAVSEYLGVAGVPREAETKRARRDLAIAIGTGGRAHLAHASCAETIDLIRSARRSGARVTCEVTPHHFMLDESAVLRHGPNAKMAPPLRARRDVDAMREAIADGTIDMIASDHAPHDPVSKRLDVLARCFDGAHDSPPLDRDEAAALENAANGVIGLETALGLAMSLVHAQVIEPRRLVELMSVNPAALLRLDAGTLGVGVPADVTIIDPELVWTVEPEKFRSRSRNTPFAGMRLRGRAMLTMVGGRIVYDGRKGDA
jgi:dihydroorotase